MTWSHDWPSCRICAALLYPEDGDDICTACAWAETREGGGLIDGTALGYEASPDCRTRQCRITFEHLTSCPVVAYQHGPNPESVLLVDAFSPVGTGEDASTHVRRQFRAFAERCHRYEDGESVDVNGWPQADEDG